MLKKISLVLVFVLTVSLLIACGSGQNNGQGNGTDVVDKKTLTIAVPSEPVVLDPNSTRDSWGAMVMFNVFDPLVRMDGDGELIPALAERWEISDDGMEYTFFLREDVKFHNGKAFSAKDVKFSLERAINDPASKRFTSPFDSVEVLSDYVAKLKLKYPFVATLKLLTQANNCIVSEETFEEMGEDKFKNNPVGTGPFVFESIKPGDSIVLNRYDDYYQGAAKIEQIVFRNIPERTTALIALETGDIDVCINVADSDIQTVTSNPDLNLSEIDSATYWYIVFNTNTKPFDNKLVRQALNMAIDVDEIIEVALEGNGTPANIPIHNRSVGYIDSVKRAPHDLEKAKDLMKEAGYPDGFSVKFYAREDNSRKVGQAVQQQLSKIGVDVEIVVMERTAFITDLELGKMPLAISTNNDLVLDACFPLDTLNGELIGSGGNYSFYVNPKYDELNRKQNVEQDPEKRNELIKEALLIENEDVPRMPLFYPKNNLGMNKNLKGIEAHPTHGYFWYTAYWEK